MMTTKMRKSRRAALEKNDSTSSSRKWVRCRTWNFESLISKENEHIFFFWSEPEVAAAHSSKRGLSNSSNWKSWRKIVLRKKSLQLGHNNAAALLSLSLLLTHTICLCLSKQQTIVVDAERLSRVNNDDYILESELHIKNRRWAACHKQQAAAERESFIRHSTFTNSAPLDAPNTKAPLLLLLFFYHFVVPIECKFQFSHFNCILQVRITHVVCCCCLDRVTP